MDCERIIDELGRALGIDLRLSEAGTCGVFFDEDEIFFERHEDQLYLIAELGTSAGREDAHSRLLEANYLGQECGQGVIGIDADRREFVLHRVLDGEMDYPSFERALTVFVQATRYWKRWLAEPPQAASTTDAPYIPMGGMMA